LNRNPGNKKFHKEKKIQKSHSSRLEQVEDRISGLEDKMDIKEKTQGLLDKTQDYKEIHKNSETPSKDQT
jgi:hypothetical protein